MTANFVSAQISRGSVWLGGSAGYYQREDEVLPSLERQRSFNLSPAIGKAFRDNVILGIELSFSGQRIEGNNLNGDYDRKTNSYALSIFGRRYGQLFKNFYLFGHAAVGGGPTTETMSAANQQDIDTAG